MKINECSLHHTIFKRAKPSIMPLFRLHIYKGKRLQYLKLGYVFLFFEEFCLKTCCVFIQKSHISQDILRC